MLLFPDITKQQFFDFNLGSAEAQGKVPFLGAKQQVGVVHAFIPSFPTGQIRAPFSKTSAEASAEDIVPLSSGLTAEPGFPFFHLAFLHPLFLRRCFQGEFKNERRTCSRLTLNQNVSAVHFNEPFDQEEPEPGPFVPALEERVKLLKRLEKGLLFRVTLSGTDFSMGGTMFTLSLVRRFLMAAGVSFLLGALAFMAMG